MTATDNNTIQKSAAQICNEFAAHMRASGITPPEVIQADGQRHRFSTNDKAKDKAGWYVLHADGIPTGVCGDWRTGSSSKWVDDPPERKTTPEEKAQSKQRIDAARQQAEAERKHSQASAAQKAQAMWSAATPCEHHAYLAAKGVASYGLRVHGGNLLIPLFDANNVLQTLQTISARGEKRFMAGGMKRGGFFVIGTLAGAIKVVVCEGYSTGASIHAATGLPVVCAMDAGNIPVVAQALRQQYAVMEFVFGADDDCLNPVNAGIIKATEAAQLVGGYLAIPQFGADRTKEHTDFNDLHQLHGLEAVKACIDAAKPIEPEAEADEGSQVVITSFADIKPEAIDWLWYGWLARGKFHLLAGEPGQGKTTIAMAMAATVSMGGKWADGSRCERGRVLIWSGEDDPADTLAPRLLAAGANVQRCSYLTGKRDKSGQAQPFDPAKDMPQLEAALRKMGGVDLLVIDPVVSAITGDSHKNAETRRDLQAIVDLATAQKCAVLGITHFSKGGQGNDPTQRVIGSVAFTAVARVVLVAAKAKDKEGKETRILARSKANIADDSGGFEYYLEQTTIEGGIEASRIAWGQAVEGSARELLTDPNAPEDEGATDAVATLRGILDDEEATESNLVFKAMSEQGYTKKQTRTASYKLQVCKKKAGITGGQKWYWRLPASPKTAAKEGDQLAQNDQLAQLAQHLKLGKLGKLHQNGQIGQVASPDFDQPADPVQTCNLHTNAPETLKTDYAIVTNSPVGDGAETGQTSPINPDITAPDYVEITI